MAASSIGSIRCCWRFRRRTTSPPRSASSSSGLPVKTVSLVGSTGSIGTQSVDVVGASPGQYRVVAIGAFSSVETLVAQAERLRPDRVALADPARAAELAERLPAGVELLVGEDALPEIAT